MMWHTKGSWCLRDKGFKNSRIVSKTTYDTLVKILAIVSLLIEQTILKLIIDPCISFHTHYFVEDLVINTLLFDILSEVALQKCIRIYY